MVTKLKYGNTNTYFIRGAKGMLTAYFNYKLQGQSLITYANEAVKLAETVTYMKTEDIKRVQSLVIAVTSLVGIVNSVYRSK